MTVKKTTLEQVRSEIDAAFKQWCEERDYKGAFQNSVMIRSAFTAGYSMGYAQATKDANGFLSQAFNSGNGSYIP